MEIIVPIILLSFLAICIHIRLRKKNNFNGITVTSRKLKCFERIFSNIYFIILLCIISVISLIPGTINYFFDQIEIPITNDSIWVRDYNVNSDGIGEEIEIFEYRVYNEWYDGFRRYFNVKNHDRFIDYLLESDLLIQDYRIDNQNIIYLLVKDNRVFYLVYNEIDFQYFATPSTINFKLSGINDYIPLVFCDFFGNDNYYTSNSEIVSFTSLTWNQVKDLYIEYYNDYVIVNENNQSVGITNLLSGNSYIIFYDDNMLTIRLSD